MDDQPPQAGTARSGCSRILVVEDNLLIRRSVVAQIKRTPGFECCGEADTVTGTASLIAEVRPDLVVLDLQLRDGEAFGLIASLKLQSPSLPVLIFSSSDDPARVARALQAGAHGYLLKEDASESLIDAIRALLQGESYVSRSLTYLFEDPAVPAT